MKVEIIEKSWYKRRLPTDEPKAISVELDGFEYVTDHFCKMIVTYDDNKTETLIARVIFNKLTQQWAVDGMKVAVRIVP